MRAAFGTVQSRPHAVNCLLSSSCVSTSTQPDFCDTLDSAAVDLAVALASNFCTNLSAANFAVRRSPLPLFNGRGAAAARRLLPKLMSSRPSTDPDASSSSGEDASHHTFDELAVVPSTKGW